MLRTLSLAALKGWLPAVGVGLAIGSCAVMAIEAQGYHTVTPSAALMATNARLDSLRVHDEYAVAAVSHHVDSLTEKVDVVLTLLCASVTERQLRFPNVRLECRATGQIP
ncbi:MAG TPA: hypothetical protein VLC11_07650 [Gemmatimonadales bacterium]|nr:hypothetical protein [Gemmatimonadales bacterium]